MASTFRVATLETAFVADTSNIDAAVKSVRGETDALDGQVTEAHIVADATDALRQIDDVRDELDDIEEIDPTIEFWADVERVQQEMDDLTSDIHDLDDEDVEIDIDVDADKARDGIKRAEDGLGEFKDEANSTAREAGASFTGSFEDIADTGQEILANAFAGFGPAGAAAGLAAAAGLGTAIAKAQELSEANTEAKETAADIATGYVEGVDDAADRFREWATEVQDDKAWTFWKDEATTNIQQVSDDLKALGEDGAAALSAIASGSLTDMRSSLVDVNDELDMLSSKLRQSAEVAESGGLGGGAAQLLDMAQNTEYATQKLGEYTAADEERRESLVRAKEVLEEHIGTQEEAEDISVALLVATQDMTEAEAEQELQLRRTNAETRTKNDLLQSSMEASLDLADGLANLTDKEDGWNASLNESTQQGRDNKREIIALTDDIQSLGEATLEQTGEQGKANKAMRDARRDLINTAESAGYNRKEVRKLVDQILDIPGKAETDIDADTKSARSKARDVVRDINRMSGNIDVGANTAQARAEIDAVLARAAYAALQIGLNVFSNADGRVVDYFADGAENHVAQIAPAGAWRVWAEPETGGEAYIPLSPSKRSRSMDILSEVADRFGATILPRANGSVDAGMPAASSPLSVTATARLDPRDVQAIAAAVRSGAAEGLAGHERAQDARSRYVRS